MRGLEAGLLAAGFDPKLPTYVLAECVLVYMEAHESAAVVRWLGSFLSSAACVVYEQVRSSGFVAAAEQWTAGCLGNVMLERMQAVVRGSCDTIVMYNVCCG